MENILNANSKEALMQALGDRYGRKKSSLYDWLKLCGISALKRDGNYSFSEGDQAKLDRLNEWVNGGNKPIEFPERVQTTAIALSEEDRIEQATTQMNFNFDGQPDAIAALIRAAQEQAAGVSIAKNLLTAQFLGNPDQLPEDLREQVKQSQTAIAPKSKSPIEYASQFMEMATAA
jgi:hypothetical protein